MNGNKENSATMDKTIRLSKVWSVGSRLDGGGFAEVYNATGDDGTVAVVKKIPKEPGAQRELLFESLQGTVNVIPILDSGEVEDAFVIVMPLAEISLRKHLRDHGGLLDQDEVTQILEDVASALDSLSATVVHRDLKPENILRYKGKWCLADFGIARYAEVTTAPDTRKFAKTNAYASPEQWRGERATHATDVYAFGITAFELLEGNRPFSGLDLRDQHLKQAPPRMTKATASLASIVNDCLYKAPAARPTASNVLKRLHASKQQATPGMSALQQVNQRIAEQQAEQSAKVSAERSVEETRAELFEAGKLVLSRIVDELIERAGQAAPATQIARLPKVQLRLGQAVLTVDPVARVASNALAVGSSQPAFDVVAQTVVLLKKQRDRYDYEGRAHTLWYCDAQEEGVYRWYETAFMFNPLTDKRSTVEPFSLDAKDRDAGLCFSMIMHSYQLAWPPLPFDQGDEEQFIERWLNWFAAAAEGNLMRPNMMPERSGSDYRKSRS